MHKVNPLLWGGLIATIVALFLVLFSNARADTGTSAWLFPSNLNLQKQTDLSTIPPALNGNIDCLQEDSFSCVVNTSYGYVSPNGTAKLNNTSSYNQLLSYVDNRPRLIPVPSSDTIINYTTEPPYGFYLYFTRHLASSVSRINNSGSLQYQINRPPDANLADKSGQRLAADYESVSFSANGQWMIVSVPNVTMLRVNLETFEVLPFAGGFNYTIGLSPKLQTAISNDGRYAVVASKDFNSFSIYDLSTCGPAPDAITGPVDCQSRDLQDLMTQQVPGYSSASHIRFISDDTLSVYANYDSGAGQKIAKFLLSDADGALHQLDYLALGDSYISGEGAFKYQAGTDTNDNTCHLSLVSYPYLLSKDLSYNSYHSVACSGAAIQDIIDNSSDYRGQSKPKIRRQDRGSQVNSILGQFLPGYIDQLDFVTIYQPKALTLSVGGNDIGFSNILKRCLATDTCYSTYEERLELVREINNKFPALVSTYQTIKNQSPPDAGIYVISYPQIAKPDGNCALNVHLNAQELDFAQQIISYLDLVIQKAAAKAGVYYVDAQDALNGHRLCEAGPGSVAINGLTAGNDFFDFLYGPIGRESYHPNDFGHQLLENKMLAATHNLSNPMPDADLSAVPPPETGLEILNAPRSGKTLSKVSFNNNLASDVLERQFPSEVSVDGLEFSLVPGSSYQAVLNSEAVDLGSFSTDASGNLVLKVQIPASLPVGFHRLHIYGPNLAGEPLDIYKTVYLAASQDDYDGDGITNSADPCVVMEPANQDYDQDGLDDSCDGLITQPPVSPPPNPTPEPSLPPPPSPAPNPPSEGWKPTSEVVLNISTTNNGLLAAAAEVQPPPAPRANVNGLSASSGGFRPAVLSSNTLGDSQVAQDLSAPPPAKISNLKIIAIAAGAYSAAVLFMIWRKLIS